MIEYKFNTFYQALKHYAYLQPNVTAIVIKDKKISFSKLHDFTNRVASFLQSRNVKPGDRVGIFLNNCWEYIPIVYAISKVGAVAVPINTHFKSQELSSIIEDANIDVFFANDSLRDIVVKSIAIHKCPNVAWIGNDVVGTRFKNILKAKDTSIEIERSLDDVASIFYTSGTTGDPKGAILTNRNMLFNAISANKLFKATKKDRSVVFLPLFHIYSYNVAAFLPLNLGASIVMIPPNTPFSEILKSVYKNKVTLFFGIPNVYDAMAKSKLSWRFMKFNKIRLFVSGAVAMPLSVHVAMQEKFKKIQLVEGYGLTEASPIVTINPPNGSKISSVGKPIPGCEVKIVNERCLDLSNKTIGEVIVKGDNVMKGYLNREKETKEAIVKGWLHTGDLGYIDEDGYLYIVDRKKDVIIVNGLNIYPTEIEQIVNQFDGVKRSAVIAKKDELRNDIPICYIELEDSDKELNIEKLVKYLKGFLADYKIPSDFVYIEKIPVGPSGKILKEKLKQIIIEKEHKEIIDESKYLNSYY